MYLFWHKSAPSSHRGGQGFKSNPLSSTKNRRSELRRPWHEDHLLVIGWLEQAPADSNAHEPTNLYGTAIRVFWLAYEHRASRPGFIRGRTSRRCGSRRRSSCRGQSAGPSGLLAFRSDATQVDGLKRHGMQEVRGSNPRSSTHANLQVRAVFSLLPNLVKIV